MFGNVLWKKVRRGELDMTEGEEIAEAFLSACLVTLRASSPVLRQAIAIVVAFERTIYDALYLSPAIAETSQLITADERLSNALQGTGLEQYVLCLHRS